MDLKEIRRLVKLLEGTDVAEIEIREDTQTVRITRQLGHKEGMLHPPQPMITYLNAPLAKSRETMDLPIDRNGEPSASKAVAITSPMVGTYYHATSPDTLPFVSRGDVIKKGQVVCIIEAMKLMNEIESEYSGRVVSILKENASPVEYGEILFMVEPT